MKKFDKLVLMGFIGPYLLSFFVAEFVLVMQFLWKYIDEILGKGFSMLEILELISYFMVTQIPMALPIAILISSVMVFGNMSEKYELASMKSAGVSLLRIMLPGIMLAIATMLLSLLASNYLKPQANFKFQKRFRAIRAQKPSLTIEPKIFNRDFNGFAIRVSEKDDDTGNIRDVLIYDHSNPDKSLLSLMKSTDGKMYNDETGNVFVMELNNGIQYEEQKRTRGKDGKRKYPMARTEFGYWKKSFDLSQFDTDDDGIQINRNKEDMLNTFQLLIAIDSVEQQKLNTIEKAVNVHKGRNDNLERQRKRQEKLKRDFEKKNKKEEKLKWKSLIPEFIPISWDTVENKGFIFTIEEKSRRRYLSQAIERSSTMRDELRSANSDLRSANKRKDKYLLRLHQQYAFAIICLVFMFVGGPLGSIIRKGGYGYPLLIAILFYMVFIITSIMGEKLIRGGNMDPILAAWISNIIVGPIAAILTYMALKDKKLKAS